MVPQSRRPKSDHPLPLWLRLGLVLFVVLLVIGGAILWIIQGAQAIVPIALLTALSILIALFQSFPALFPLREHEQDTKLRLVIYRGEYWQCQICEHGTADEYMQIEGVEPSAEQQAFYQKHGVY